MIIVEAVMIACMVTIGMHCAISDIRRNIVPNKLLLIGCITGLALHLLYLILGGAGYYPSWALCMLIADGIAVFLYAMHIWAAGDVKLFAFSFLLFPPRLLDVNSPAQTITIYILIFVPSLLWVAIDSVIRFLKKEEKFHQPIHWKQFAISFLVILIESTAVYCVFHMLFTAFTEENEMLVSFVTVLYAMFCSSWSSAKKWYVILIHTVIVLIGILSGSYSLYLPDWKSPLLLSGVLLFQQFISGYNYKRIRTSDIQPRMILSAETILLFAPSRVKGLPQNPSEELDARITAEEAEAVKRWESSAQGKPTILIVRKIPFAIMISIGFILWFILRAVR